MINNRTFIKDFNDRAEFIQFDQKYSEIFRAHDNKAITSLNSEPVVGYCVCCDKHVQMSLNFRHANIRVDGSINIAWSEQFKCEFCGLNSRLRAVLNFLLSVENKHEKRVWLLEHKTEFADALEKIYPRLTKSEFLGTERSSGEYFKFENELPIMHQDILHPSFEPESFDLIVHNEVLEHVADYQRAISECSRLLVTGGQMVFTTPFFFRVEKTVQRTAIVDSEVKYLLPAVYHGNPISNKGSLVFFDFGWDILEAIEGAGLSPKLKMYYDPLYGHKGYGMFIFVSEKII